MCSLASLQAGLFVNKAECVSALRNSRQLARARQWLRFCTDNGTSVNVASALVCLALGDFRALRARATSRCPTVVRIAFRRRSRCSLALLLLLRATCAQNLQRVSRQTRQLDECAPARCRLFTQECADSAIRDVIRRS